MSRPSSSASAQRLEGYGFAGSFEDGDKDAAGVAGFRVGHLLAWGKVTYVDDVSTRATYRGCGHAGALMDWLIALNKGPRNSAHHFQIDLRKKA